MNGYDEHINATKFYQPKKTVKQKLLNSLAVIKLAAALLECFIIIQYGHVQN